MRKALLFIALFSLIVTINAQTPTGDEILKRIDQNLIFEQAISVSTMIVHSRTGDRTIQSKAWSRGNDKAFSSNTWRRPAKKAKKCSNWKKTSGFTRRNPAIGSSPSQDIC